MIKLTSFTPVYYSDNLPNSKKNKINTKTAHNKDISFGKMPKAIVPLALILALFSGCGATNPNNTSPKNANRTETEVTQTNEQSAKEEQTATSPSDDEAAISGEEILRRISESIQEAKQAQEEQTAATETPPVIETEPLPPPPKKAENEHWTGDDEIDGKILSAILNSDFVSLKDEETKEVTFYSNGFKSDETMFEKDYSFVEDPDDEQNGQNYRIYTNKDEAGGTNTSIYINIPTDSNEDEEFEEDTDGFDSDDGIEGTTQNPIDGEFFQGDGVSSSILESNGASAYAYAEGENATAHTYIGEDGSVHAQASANGGSSSSSTSSSSGSIYSSADGTPIYSDGEGGNGPDPSSQDAAVTLPDSTRIPTLSGILEASRNSSDEDGSNLNRMLSDYIGE